MKGMKGRFLKKLKLIPTVGSLKQSLVHQLNPLGKHSNRSFQAPPVHGSEELEFGNTSISRLVYNTRDEEMDLEMDVDDGESSTASIEYKKTLLAKDNPEEVPVSSEIGMEDCNDDYYPSLEDFTEQGPPGGSDSVILYTTSLRSIRKTFEDCNTMRFLLGSFKVLFYERDVSMHLEFREELWKILGGRVIPPRLFIRGRYIGGADEVVGLHEQGKLKKLLEGIPVRPWNNPCTGCGNMRFVVCFDCSGSRKVVTDGEKDEICIRCPDCNENGLVKCPICS